MFPLSKIMDDYYRYRILKKRGLHKQLCKSLIRFNEKIRFCRQIFNVKFEGI
jgi:hypothetical protein